MWITKSKINSETQILDKNNQALSFKLVIALWQENVDFRQFFIDLLAQSPFDGYRWECPAVTSQTLDRPFEFVLIDDPYLARRRPDMGAFRQHFNNVPGDGAVTFPNLGGDAVMVVPEPARPEIDYGHLGAFCQHAPQSQQHELWRSVGDAMGQRILAKSEKPVWLNTAGGGVAWLHVRLDDRPKYYRHAPYRE